METTNIRRELIRKVINKIFALINYDDKYLENGKQMINAEETLTRNEKIEAIEQIKNSFEKYIKIRSNTGEKRFCENCQQDCLAISYCEHCIRNHLKTKFSICESGNDDIDDLIQKCQMGTISPDKIIEWIPYNHLENVEYLTEGGCSKIYSADWIGGRYNKWDDKEKQLKRGGTCKVILKSLENIKSANRNWYEEVGYFKPFFLNM